MLVFSEIPHFPACHLKVTDNIFYSGFCPKNVAKSFQPIQRGGERNVEDRKVSDHPTSHRLETAQR